jgi:hypothetical protein
MTYPYTPCGRTTDKMAFWRRPIGIFSPFGHPTLYAYGPAMASKRGTRTTYMDIVVAFFSFDQLFPLLYF